MKALSRQEWAEIMARFVTKIGQAAHETYEELCDSDHEVKEPIRAEPFSSMLADGVIGMLTMLNDLNKKEVENNAGVEKFDVVQLFTQEMFIRLTNLGYTTAIDQKFDPEAYDKAIEAVKSVEKPSSAPSGTEVH